MRRLEILFTRIKHLFKGKPPIRSILKIFLWFLTLVTGVLLIFFVLVWTGVFGPLPSTKDLQDIQNPLASEVYSADSVLLGRYFIQERSDVRSEDIPESLKNALVATEDVRFYNHHGIDYRSLGRVLVKSILLQRESAGGGSTITQQLAKNLFPRQSYGFLSMPVNKVREFIIATRLEKNYTKDELLVLYLNTIPFADNTYGVKTAADRFFSSKVKDLTTDQSAVLIGMLKATHYYNPRLFPERAKTRRDVVISQMARYGFISDADKRKLQLKPIALRYNNANDNTSVAPYFRAYIQKALLKWCEENRDTEGERYNLYTDGLKIYTTIDSRIQKHAEAAVASQMKNLQAKFKDQISKRDLEKITLATLKKLPEYKELISRGQSDKDAIKKLKTVRDTRVFTWEGEKIVKMSVYDSIMHHTQFLQAGVMAMSPQTGAVLAWVGGINHQYFKYDHVRETTKRQIGSTFKPIVYAAALENGIGPCTYISARKTVYTNMDDWTPENSDEGTYDKKYSMKGGLTESVNTVSVKLIEQTGIGNTIQLARRMGIESDLPAVPSIALGTPSISVQEMVGAYCVFANGGVYHEPQAIKMITDRKGRILEKYKQAESKRALSQETARMMVHMLESVVSEGTGSSLRSKYGLSNDLAGKTGTTQSNKDGWFIAVSPRLVVGSWVGADDPRMHFKTTALGQGAATALPIVAKLYQNANKDRELQDIMYARFDALPERLLAKMDCKPSKSGLNIFEKIFGSKKKTKVKKFKGGRRSGGIFARRSKN
jgi:penicillin-binding protein 1A